MEHKNDTGVAYARLHDVIVRLRAPGGCPWDREQTPGSVRGNLIEEAYECVEAINDNDTPHVMEEIGDVIMVATMIAVMNDEAGAFSVAQALDSVTDKLVRRHPHVFGESKADTPDAVIEQWNDIKEKVEGRRKKDSVLDSVSRALPPLERAYKLGKAAAKVGFDWPETTGPWDKLAEELSEAREACLALDGTAETATPEEHQAGRGKLEDEIGDLLFSVINVARAHKVDPAIALHRTIEKFSRRFHHVEKSMAAAGLVMKPEALDAMERFWQEAKATGR